MKENDHRKEEDIRQMYLIEYSILLMKSTLSMNIERLKYFDKHFQQIHLITIVVSLINVTCQMFNQCFFRKISSGKSSKFISLAL